jgi:hypothetical protein
MKNPALTIVEALNVLSRVRLDPFMSQKMLAVELLLVNMLIELDTDKHSDLGDAPPEVEPTIH